MVFIKEKPAFVAFVLLMGVLQIPSVAGGQVVDSLPRGPLPDKETLGEMNARIASHEFDRAERLLDELLQRGANPSAAYFQIGKLYFDHQEWERSARFLQKCLELQNSNDQAHLLLGLALRQLKKPDQAEREFLEATKENPSSDVNAYFAGHQLLLNEKYEAALAYLYKAIELNPHRSQALRAIAMSQAHVGNYGLAESYYRKAIEVAGKSGEADYADTIDLGLLLLMGHDRAKLLEGLKYAQRAVELRPGSAEAHYLAGKALFKLGRLQEAIAELQQSEKSNPQDSKTHFLLAQAFQRLGQYEKAQKERDALARTHRRPGQAGIATANPVPTSSE